MKYLLLIGLIMAGLVLVQFAQGQSVAAIVAKYVEARGGMDRLLGIQSIYMEGTRNLSDGEPLIITRETKVQNKLYRVDFDRGDNKGFVLFTANEGWRSFGGVAPIKLTNAAVEDYQNELDIVGPLVNYAAKGHKAELLGKDTLNGVECFTIKLLTEKGKEVFYWLDAQSYLLVKSQEKFRNDRDLKSRDVIMLYSNYKGVDNVLFPHTILIKDMADNLTTFNKIELNIPIDAKLYKPE